MNQRRWHVAALLAAALAAGCGQDAAQAPAGEARAGVAGSVTKGPLQGATVDFYALDVGGNAVGSPLVSSVTTDSSGRFVVSGLPANVPVLVKTSGGSYIDESDTEPNPSLRRRITFASTDRLEAVLPPNQTQLAITPYSMALYKKAYAQAAGGNFANVYAAVELQATQAFGFDPILTIPADPATGAGGNQAYAILLGAAAQAINGIATGAGHLPGFADVMAFVTDFSDGQLDGSSLAAEIRRFRNNNISIYGGVAEPTVDETALSQPAPVPNTVPTITAIADQTIVEEGNTGALGFTIADTENPATSLTLSGASSNAALVPVSNIVFGGSGGSRTVTVTPVANGFGTTTISITVTDADGGTATEPFLLTVTGVNDPPVANSDSISMAEGGTASILVGGATSVLSNDTDPDSDPLTATLVTGPANAASFLLNTDGTFNYLHDNSETTSDSFTYLANDGSANSNVATVTISINPVNDPPVAVDDTAATSEDVPLDIPASSLVANDVDPDGPALSVTAVSNPVNGSVVLVGGTVTFTPSTDFPGPTGSFDYTVSDGSLADTGTVTVTITAVNDPPVAGNDAYGGMQGGTIATIAAVDGLLLNDADVDNTPAELSVTITPVTPPAFGSLTLNSDGSFSYTHDGSANLADSFDYEVCDLQPACDIGTVSLTLSPSAAAPLLPFLTGSGELKLFDPLGTETFPVPLDSGLPTTGLATRTLFKASLSGSIATDIRPGMLLYIKGKKIWRVNLERGTLHAPEQVSTIADACRFNGNAEDIPNPGNSIVRVDTAGLDGICQNGGGDDSAAPAYLVTVGTGATVAIGNGQCCGTTGITNASGALIGVLTAEDDGLGSTFSLVRRNVSDLTIAVPIATLAMSGAGPVYGNLTRGLGQQNIYIRARRDVTDATFKLLRFDVASDTLTPVFDYGVADASSFNDQLDNGTLDSLNVYFISADRLTLWSVPHAATGPGSATSLATAVVPIQRLEQTTDRIAYETGGITGGVFSVLKDGTAPVNLTLNDNAPTVATLDTTDRGRVYISVLSPGSYIARAIGANGSGALPDIADAQWAGESFDPAGDFNDDIEASFQDVAIYLRRGAASSTADIEIVNPVTGLPTGAILGQVAGVFQGKSVFAFGFGRYAQLSAFAADAQADIYFGDAQAATQPSLQLVSNVPASDDRWLLGEGDGGGGGTPAAATLLVSRAAGTAATTGSAKSELGIRRSSKVSADGRYVVFESRAGNLVSGQIAGGATDNVFLFDQVTGLNTLVSHLDGSPVTTGNGDSLEPTISANGRYVAFRSTSNNLVSGQSEGSVLADVFLFDRLTGLNTLVSHIPGAPASTGDGESLEPVINPDGRYVVFKSVATNLASGQIAGGGTNHLFLFDRVTGLNTLVSHAAGAPATTGDGDSREPAISTDGRYVAFASTGTNLVSAQIDTNGIGEDAFLFDRDTGVNTLVSHVPGVPATTGNNASFFPVISADGRYVAFASNGTDLVSGQGEGNASTDVFLFDRVTDVNTLISHTPGVPATTANGQSFQPAISADGGFVSFLSAATNLVSGQADTNLVNDAFLFDRGTGVTTLISHTSGAPATTGDGAPLFPSISADGRFVSFLSAATNLVSAQADTNGVNDTFLFDRVTGPGLITLVSHADGVPATTGNNSSSGHAISAEGRFVAFQSGAGDLVGGQTDSNGGLNDVFLFTVTGIASLDSDGDGLSNIIETTIYFTDPNNPDSDFDQITDADEVNVHGTNPNAPDTDGDGLSDGAEVNTTSTNPLNPDSDSDFVGDGVEIEAASNPLNVNTVILADASTACTATCDGLTWPTAFNTQSGVLTAVGAGGTTAANQVFVLYAGGAYGPLDLTGATRAFSSFVGSVGPGIYSPAEPPNTVFSAGGAGSVVAVNNGTDIAFRSIEVTNGNAGTGGGIFVTGPASVTLRKLFVHNNAASDGGGAAVTAFGQLTVNDSQFSANVASAPSIGGRGGGIYVSDGTLDVSSSRFLSNQANNFATPAPTNGGGGVYAEGANAVVRIKDSLFADNSAVAGPGGGVNLIDIATMSIENSQFLSNQSTRPGGGLHLHQNALPSNPTNIFNNLFVGNATTDPATEGGAIEIEHSAGVLKVDSNTVAYNQMVNDASTGFGGGVSINPVNGTEFRNNILWFNDNATVGGALEPGDNFFAGSAPAPIAPAGNNIDDAQAQGNTAGMPLDPLFSQGFYLKQSGNASVDGGADLASSVFNFAFAPFTTDSAGAPDSGTVDTGFHHGTASAGTFNAVSLQTGSVDLCTGPQPVIFVPAFANAPNGEAGHLIVVEASLPPGISMSSVTTLDPRASGSRIARDLGDGRYAVTIGGGLANSSGTFTIYADDGPTPQGFVLTITSPC